MMARNKRKKVEDTSN